MGALVFGVGLFLVFFIFFSLLYLFRTISDVDNEVIGIVALLTSIFVSAYTIAYFYTDNIRYEVENNKIKATRTQNFWFMNNKDVKYYDINKTYPYMK